MISIGEKVLYSAIKIYGPIHPIDAADVYASAHNIKLHIAKADIKVITCPRNANNVLQLNSKGEVCISKPCPEVSGEEYLPYAKMFDIFQRWRR